VADITPYQIAIARLSEPGGVWFTLCVFRSNSCEV